MNLSRSSPINIDDIDLSEIPTMPSSAMKIMAMIFNEDVNIDQLIKTIKHDVALSSEIIKSANSPIYRTTTPIDNIGNAIMHLGLDKIKKIVLSTAVIGTIKGQLSEANYCLIISQSLATAAAAQIIAEHTENANAETAFLIGLFLNLGLFVCANLYPNEFEYAHNEAQKRGLQLSTILENYLLIEIHQITLKIATQWKLPKSILENINCHELIAKKNFDPSFNVPPLSIISYLSTMAADVYLGSSSIMSIEKFKEGLKKFLGKGEDEAKEILVALSKEFNDVASMLNLTLEKQPDYTDILKKANIELLKINTKYERMYQELLDKNKEMLALTNKLDKRNKHLNKLVTTDPLTLLYNRRFLEISLKRLIAESKRYESRFSVIMLDIDFFTAINDKYGNKVGDDALTQVAKLIKDSCRECDICARYESEEFIIVLPQTALKDAIVAADKCRKLLENFNISTLSPPLTIKLTASFGLATYTEQVNQAEQLLKEAKKQLGQAKANGRNCVFPNQ